MWLLQNLHNSITHAIKADGISTRPDAGLGAWLLFLLPTSVLVTATTPLSQTHLLICLYAINTLLNSLVLLYHATANRSLHVTSAFNISVAIPIAVSTFLFHEIAQLDLQRSFCHSLANALIYFECLPFLLKALPKAFTFGEANLNTQGLSLFMYSLFIRLDADDVLVEDEFQTATTITQVGLLAILILCVLLYAVPTLRSPVGVYVTTFTIIAALILAPLHFLLDRSPVFWLLDFISSTKRLVLLGVWSICSHLAASCIQLQVSTSDKASTITRKAFHCLLTIVYITGVLFDIGLLYVASVIVLALFILLEVLRVLGTPPLAPYLELGFQVFSDPKDSGGVSLTPLYLLLGCSAPLWLLPCPQDPTHFLVPLLSGVLSTGVGDSCASAVGKKFGKHKWKGSDKTVEGTFGCVLGQILLLGLFCALDLIPLSHWMMYRAVFAIVVTSLVEAWTDQVDNIVLPLVNFILLTFLNPDLSQGS